MTDTELTIDQARINFLEQNIGARLAEAAGREANLQVEIAVLKQTLEARDDIIRDRDREIRDLTPDLDTPKIPPVPGTVLGTVEIPVEERKDRD